jgi:NADH-quinone oxidoreductase subunit N
MTLLPEALVVAGAVGILLLPRFQPGLYRRVRVRLPAAAAAVILAALVIELWAGAAVGTFFDGGLVQDRFALFAKAAALLAAGAAIVVADWSSEDSPAISLAMPMLAAFGVMVVASAGDFVGLWAGLELAGATGVAMLALRRPDLALRLLVAGAAGSALMLAGLAFVYAGAGTANLLGVQTALVGAAPTLPLAIPVLLALGALAFRATVAPLQLVGVPGLAPPSPMSSGVITGLVAAAALVAAVKIATVVSPVQSVYSSYLEVVAAIAMVGGGAAALAIRSPRARMAFIAAGQAGWVLAALSTHYRLGTGAAVFMLGAFAVAATAGPAVAGSGGLSEAALAGMGTLRPARAAALALALLSLAGFPPLAGFFGEFSVGASLAQSGHIELLGLGLLGSAMSAAAAIGTIRTLYLMNPLEEGRRGGAILPALSRFSAGGAVALCIVIAGYALLASPIMTLADQSAEGLGLR